MSKKRYFFVSTCWSTIFLELKNHFFGTRNRILISMELALHIFRFLLHIAVLALTIWWRVSKTLKCYETCLLQATLLSIEAKIWKCATIFPKIWGFCVFSQKMIFQFQKLCAVEGLKRQKILWLWYLFIPFPNFQQLPYSEKNKYLQYRYICSIPNVDK